MTTENRNRVLFTELSRNLVSSFNLIPLITNFSTIEALGYADLNLQKSQSQDTILNRNSPIPAIKDEA